MFRISEAKGFILRLTICCLTMGEDQGNFFSLLTILQFARRDSQNKLNSFCPRFLLPFSQSLQLSHPDYRNGNDVIWRKKLKFITVKFSDSQRHIPHCLAQSVKTIHVVSASKSSKFRRRGGFDRPGGKATERLVKTFLSNVTVIIANAIPSKRSPPIAYRMLY